MDFLVISLLAAVVLGAVVAGLAWFFGRDREATVTPPQESGDRPDAPPGGLVDLDLPSPEQMRDRWAATAAAFAGIGYGTSDCRADAGDWYYHDGGGNWARLYRYSDGRALLVGQDHEDSATYFGEAAAFFETAETDLLAGAPAWWGDAVTFHSRRDGEWIAWIYGWDGRVWRRAAYQERDGFDTLALPPVSLARTVEILREFGWGDDNPPDDDTRAAVRLVSAGPSATEAQVAALGPAIVDPAAGAAVTRGFQAPGQH